MDHAIGDGARDKRPVRRLAEGAVLRVAAGARDEMGRVEAVDVIAAPDHLCRHAPPLREGGEPLDRVADDVLAIVQGAERRVEHRIVGVVRINEADVALVPDPVRASDDVIDDVGVDRIETTQALRPRPVSRRQVDIVTPLHLQHFFARGVLGKGLGLCAGHVVHGVSPFCTRTAQPRVCRWKRMPILIP